METLELVTPAVEYEAGFRGMLAELAQQGRQAGGWLRECNDDFAAFVQRLAAFAAGEYLPEGWVPYTTFWLIRDGREFIGESGIRSALTPALEIEGGHIWYGIRPSEQRKGYGTKLLALTLNKAREMGLMRVLITCDTANIGSAKVIEHNGGVLAFRGYDARVGKDKCRYWIDLLHR